MNVELGSLRGCLAAPSQHFHWASTVMPKLDSVEGIAIGIAIGAWIWAGIAFLVCLVFVG